MCIIPALRKLHTKGLFQSGQTSQLVKTVTTEPGDKSIIHRIHMVEGENQAASCPWTSTLVLYYANAPTHINKYNKNLFKKTTASNSRPIHGIK